MKVDKSTLEPQLRQWCAEGLTYAEMGQRLSIAVSTAAFWCRQFGLVPDTHLRRQQRFCARYGVEGLDLLERCLRAHDPLRLIAWQFDVSAERVRQWRDELFSDLLCRRYTRRGVPSRRTNTMKVHKSTLEPSLRQWCAEGLTHAEMGRRLGIAGSTAAFWCRQFGLVPDSQPRRQQRFAARYGHDALAVLERLMRSRVPLRLIGQQFGVSPERVRQWREALLPGVPCRRQTRAP